MMLTANLALAPDMRNFETAERHAVVIPPSAVLLAEDGTELLAEDGSQLLSE